MSFLSKKKRIGLLEKLCYFEGIGFTRKMSYFMARLSEVGQFLWRWNFHTSVCSASSGMHESLIKSLA